jgi:hypothetical protein
MPRTARLAVAAALLLFALPVAGVVQSLVDPAWERLVSQGSRIPPPQINVVSHDGVFDAMRSDDTSSSRRPESLVTTLCAACSGDGWSLTHRFVLPPGSQLLAELRSATATESALGAGLVGVRVQVGGVGPQVGPATIRQPAPDQSAVVEVVARWPEPPKVPAQVRLHADAYAFELTERTFTVRTGDHLVVTTLEGPAPEAQGARTVTLSGHGTELDEAGIVVSSRDAVPFDDGAVTPPRVLTEVVQGAGDLWVRMMRLAPVVVLLGILWSIRTRNLAPQLRRATRLELAVGAGSVVVGAAMVVTALGWRVHLLPTWLDERLRTLAYTSLDADWGYGTNAEYALAAVVLGFGLPTVARATEEHLLRRARPGAGVGRSAAALLVALVASVVVVVVLSRWADVWSSSSEPGERVAATAERPWGWIAAVAIGCACLVVLVMLAGGLALGPRGASPGAAVGAWFGAITLVLPWTDYAGPWPSAARFVTLAVLTAATFHALGRLTAAVGRDRPLSRSSGRARVLAVLVAVLFALPLPAALPMEQGAGVQWFYAWAVPMAVATALPLVAAVGVVNLGRVLLTRRSGPRSPATLRLVTIALGALLLFSPTALVHYVPLSYLTGLALLWMFALPARQTHQEVLGSVPDQDLAELMNRLVTAREAESGAARLRKGLDSELEKGAITWADREARLGAVRAVATQERSAAPTGGLTLDAAVLGTFPLDAWGWVKRGALVGAVAGAPWMLLSIPGLLAFVELRGYAPLLAVLTAAVELLRWPAIGVVYALGYPLLRGGTGMAKAATLFVTLAVPSAVSLLLAEGDGGAWRSLLYLVSQLFIHCMILGVVAEGAVLRRAGRPLSDLTALHNLRAVITWVSGLVAALAAAASTALVTGVTTLVLGILAPQSTGSNEPPAPTPRAASSTSIAPHGLPGEDGSPVRVR